MLKKRGFFYPLTTQGIRPASGSLADRDCDAVQVVLFQIGGNHLLHSFCGLVLRQNDYITLLIGQDGTHSAHLVVVVAVVYEEFLWFLKGERFVWTFRHDVLHGLFQQTLVRLAGVFKGEYTGADVGPEIGF